MLSSNFTHRINSRSTISIASMCNRAVVITTRRYTRSMSLSNPLALRPYWPRGSTGLSCTPSLSFFNLGSGGRSPDCIGDGPAGRRRTVWLFTVHKINLNINPAREWQCGFPRAEPASRQSLARPVLVCTRVLSRYAAVGPSLGLSMRGLGTRATALPYARWVNFQILFLCTF